MIELSPPGQLRYRVTGQGTVQLVCAQCGPFLDLGDQASIVEVLAEARNHELTVHDLGVPRHDGVAVL